MSQQVKANLEQAFDEYRRACYGDRVLPASQLQEVRQAFFSGIHWLNGSNQATSRRALTEALRDLCFPSRG